MEERFSINVVIIKDILRRVIYIIWSFRMKRKMEWGRKFIWRDNNWIFCIVLRSFINYKDEGEKKEFWI